MKKNLTLTVLALGALTIMLSAAGPARAQAKAEAGAAPIGKLFLPPTPPGRPWNSLTKTNNWLVIRWIICAWPGNWPVLKP